MRLISFVQQTINNTLLLLLDQVVRLLLTELRLLSSSKRLCRRLQIYGLEIDALRVFLLEAMPEELRTEDCSVQAQTQKYLSGIPPPGNQFIHDDGTVTDHA